MDHDNVDLNNAQEDRREWWEAVKKEQEARADKMEAEEKLKHTSMMNDFGAEMDHAGDWLEADWDEFKARVQKWSNSAQVATDEAV